MSASIKQLFYSRLRTNVSANIHRTISVPGKNFFGFGKKDGDKVEDDKVEDEVADEVAVKEATEGSSNYDETVPLPPSKYYVPPVNVEQTILSLATQHSQTDVTLDTQLTDNSLKFKILTACIREFDFTIPSYELNELNRVSDIVDYYSITRQPITPEEKLTTMPNLPENLHMQLEPIRFTDDTKDHFKGKTAFPGRDTIVTSLKYRHIYKGYEGPKEYKKKKGFRYY